MSRDAFNVVVPFGRDRELLEVDGFLGLLCTGAAGLVFEGDAGIGKSTLWRAVISSAREHGLHVLTARPAEAEAKLSYAALGDLFEGLDAALETLPDPQREALEVALVRARPSADAPDVRTVAVAVLEVLRRLSEEAPVLLAIDDVQWLDRPTARVVDFSLRRVEAARVGAVVTVRSDGPARSGAGPERSLPPERVRRVAVGPLTRDAIGHVVHRVLGLDLPAPTLTRLTRAANGNPLLAIELARALPAGEELPADRSWPVPADLRALLSHRLRTATNARTLLLAAAALGEPTTTQLRRLLKDRYDEELTAAVAAGLVALNAERVEFTHPLLASVLWLDAPEDERRALHSRVADVVSEPEARARHLALGADGPDTGLAAVLDDAAASAVSRGAPDAAAELLDLARALTPPGEEHAVHRRALRAAGRWFEAGDAGRARARLEEIVAGLPPGPMRADALSRLARVRYQTDSVDQARALSEQALDEAGDVDVLRAAIELDLALELDWALDKAAAAARAESALSVAERLGVAVIAAAAAGELTLTRFLLGGGVQRDVLERGRAWERELAVPVSMLDLHWGLVLTFLDDLDGARAVIEEFGRLVVERGWETQQAFALYALSEVERRAGRLELAGQLADESAAIARRAGQDTFRTVAIGAGALVAAEHGDVERTRALVTEGLALADRTGSRVDNICDAAMGMLALSTGDASEAAQWLVKGVDILGAAGVEESGVLHIEADTVEALVGIGSLEDAERRLERLEGNARRLDRPWGLATAARCRGLVSAARGDLAGALEWFEESRLEHKRVPIPYELGRTLLAQGRVARRAKQWALARDCLGDAVAIFESLPALLWADQARAELARVGGRRRTGTDPDTLTETEQQVAELIASGKTTREVADALFLSRRTVESHLARAYRKLGVRNRAELGTRLAGRP
ncbi:MAG: LuxR C-terminal-related transcriptional regulator [Actinomycetota bacterium]